MTDQRSNRQSWASAGPSSLWDQPPIGVPPRSRPLDPTPTCSYGPWIYLPGLQTYAENGDSFQAVSSAPGFHQGSDTMATHPPIGNPNEGWPVTALPPAHPPQHPLTAYPAPGSSYGRKRRLSIEGNEPNGGYNVVMGFGAHSSGSNVFRPHKKTRFHSELPLLHVPQAVANSFIQPQALGAGPSRIRPEPLMTRDIEHQRVNVMDILPMPHTSSQPFFRPYNTMGMSNGLTNNIHHVEFGNLGSNFGIQILNTGSLLWDSLPKPPDTSGHRSNYLKGSRDEDVRKIRTWVETPSSGLTLWIHGPAGIGKSTLAREVSQDLQMAGLLGAFIPLSSLSNDARGPESVIKMIAREIGETYRDAIPAITEAIGACKGTGAEVHLWNFVGKPMKALQRSSCIVVVLDAFDEWQFSDVLIKALDFLAPLSSIVRFILFGRSDPSSLGHKNAFTRPYPLQPVSQVVMEKYFAREFEGVKWDHGGKPSARDVSRLAEQAGGLFIWARTACSLLGKGQGLTSPNKMLEDIIYSRTKVGETGHLETLYGGALQLLFPDDERAELRQYLGMALILQEPLPLDDFSFLSGLPSRSVGMIQARLGALHIKNTIDAQPMVHPVAASFHLSFIEYLQQESRLAGSTSFASPSNSTHSDLANACLRVLATLPSGSQDLSQRQWYAARHWVSHVSEGAPEVQPGSSSDWEATELCSLLIGISSTTWDWWRATILGFFIPGYVTEAICGGGDVSNLLQGIAECLEERNPTAFSFRIACLSVATCLQPDDANLWAKLGDAYLKSAEVSPRSNLLHQAVKAHENAVTVMEAEGTSNPAINGGLGKALERRFRRLGVALDIDQSISLLQNALVLCQSGHPDHLPFLKNLARSLWSRFEVTNSLDDLQEAIVLEKEALALCSSGHPDRSTSLKNLALSLMSRFEVTNSLDDLQAAIVLEKEALALCPSGHPHRSMSLGILALSLTSRFEVTNSLDNLQEAIVLGREALALCPSGHPGRPVSLSSLATFLWSRFRATNSLDDLEEAIVLAKGALSVCPSGHPHRSATLRNLALSLKSRFEVTNSLDDLQEVIVLEKEALALCPTGNSDRLRSVSNLATSLALRFKVTNSFDDLQEAIILDKESLALSPSSHSRRSTFLSNLACSLVSRFDVTNSFEDLQEAIVLGKEALALCPSGHPQRSLSLNNLGDYLHSRFKVKNSFDDLQEAITLLREALVLRPPGHRYRSDTLGNLAAALKSRSRVTGSVEDMHEASALRQELDASRVE